MAERHSSGALMLKAEGALVLGKDENEEETQDWGPYEEEVDQELQAALIRNILLQLDVLVLFLQQSDA